MSNRERRGRHDPWGAVWDYDQELGELAERESHEIGTCRGYPQCQFCVEEKENHMEQIFKTFGPDEYKLVRDEIANHAERAQEKYGNFASVHEALGVALEEWEELKAAVHANKLESVRDEATDLAAVLIRLAVQCRTSAAFKERSVK